MAQIPSIVGYALSNWVVTILQPAIALFLLTLFRYETQLPMKIGVLVVPPVTVVGFAIAYWVHMTYAVSMSYSVAGLCALLVPLLLVYESL